MDKLWQILQKLLIEPSIFIKNPTKFLWQEKKDDNKTTSKNIQHDYRTHLKEKGFFLSSKLFIRKPY